MTKQKEEYRYQFLRFQTVDTGKYLVKKNEFEGVGLGAMLKGYSYRIPVKKEVAIVFDKKLGVVKLTDIKKLKK